MKKSWRKIVAKDYSTVVNALARESSREVMFELCPNISAAASREEVRTLENFQSQFSMSQQGPNSAAYPPEWAEQLAGDAKKKIGGESGEGTEEGITRALQPSNHPKK